MTAADDFEQSNLNLLWLFMVKAIFGAISSLKMVRLCQRFYMLEHDLGKNLNANMKDDKATR